MQRLQVHSWLATPHFSLKQVEDIRVSNVLPQCLELTCPGAAGLSQTSPMQLASGHAWSSWEGGRKPWVDWYSIDTSLLEIKAEFSFKTCLLWVDASPGAASYCITPDQDKASCHCHNCYSAFTKSEPFSFLSFPSRGGAEAIGVSVPCSRAPHKSPLWKHRAALLCSWGRKRVLFSLGLRYTTGSICTETQTHVLWDGLLRQPGQPRLIKDHRFPPHQATENSASNFYIALKINGALYNV